MPRTFNTAVQAEIDKQFAGEPMVIVEIEWRDGQPLLDGYAEILHNPAKPVDVRNIADVSSNPEPIVRMGDTSHMPPMGERLEVVGRPEDAIEARVQRAQRFMVGQPASIAEPRVADGISLTDTE